jgi:hypothetical protein
MVNYITVSLAVTLSLAACRDINDLTLVDAGSTHVLLGRAEEIPTRGSESPRNSVHTSNARLWKLLDDGRNTALVGLKAPGRNRGVWRSNWLLSRDEWNTGKQALRAQRGVAWIGELAPLPVVEIQIADSTTLRRIRDLPFVDYVEVATLSKAVLDEAIAVHGYQPAFASNCKPPQEYTNNVSYTDEGDVISYSYSSYYQYHKIAHAWRRSAGDNIRIALLDTGMDPEQTQFTNVAYFDPRPWEYHRLVDGEVGSGHGDACGHGTRMAGAIAAPNDGRSVIGVAWKSDLRVVNVATRGWSTDPTYYDYVISVDPKEAYDGIRRAMGDHLDPYTWSYTRVRPPAHIITMAFKTYNDPVYEAYPSTVADLIRYYHYGPDAPLFIAAIGTMPVGMPNAVFPAEMSEVVAVVALNPDGTRNGESNYGPSAELAAYIPVATVDVPSFGGHRGITRIMGASGATAVVSGIAAQVWSRYPWMTAGQVRARLRNSARHPHEHRWGDGYGWVDAYRAVGGYTRMSMEVKDCATEQAPQFQAVAYASGDGPFTYEWSNGSTDAIAEYTAAPAGDSVLVWVAVRDVVENKTMMDSKWVPTRTNEHPDFMQCLMN